MGASDITLTALWTEIPQTYQITYPTISGCSYSSIKPTSYTTNTGLLPVGDPTMEGYTFKGWEKDGTFVGTSYSLDTNVERKNINLKPTFTANTYAINYPSSLPAHVHKSSATGLPTKYVYKDGTTLPDINTYYYADAGYNIEWNCSSDISDSVGPVSVGIKVTPIYYDCYFYVNGSYVDSVRIIYGETITYAPTAKADTASGKVDVTMWNSTDYGSVTPGDTISNTLATAYTSIRFDASF
jgi:uncharacterized repeat protein (TIGR02543 family)